MMEEVPSYKIKYIDCTEKGHEGEKVNLICLNENCKESSLICSLCTNEKHLGHQFKPLKIYLDELSKQYHGHSNDFDERLDVLQNRKNNLLFGLRTCVEKLAEEFVQLEQDIMNSYEKMKNHLFQNQAKQKQFQTFYQSMIKDNFGDPHFQIQNYLYQPPILIFNDNQSLFHNLKHQVCQEIAQIKSHLLVLSHQQDLLISLPQKVENHLIQIPANIVREGDFFTQTNHVVGAPSMCLLDLPISGLTGKIRIQIILIAAGAKITMGIIKKTQFEKGKHILSDGVDAMWFDTLGKQKGASFCYMGQINSGVIIDLFVKKNHFKATAKNNNADFIINDKSWSFFFALEGSCKVKLTYPYLK